MNEPSTESFQIEDQPVNDLGCENRPGEAVLILFDSHSEPPTALAVSGDPLDGDCHLRGVEMRLQGQDLLNDEIALSVHGARSDRRPPRSRGHDPNRPALMGTPDPGRRRRDEMAP
ncbi:MAG: hypothetical protein ABR564_08800 [Candidatus Dormibacteria bacterium]